MKVSRFSIVTVLIYCIAICMGALRLVTINIILNFITMILTIYVTVKKMDNISNITFLFLIFHFLYGLSGPISILYGNGVADIFTQKFDLSAFFIAFDLSTIGLIIGIELSKRNKKNIENIDTIDNFKRNIDYRYLKYISFFLSAMSSLCEIINLHRVGGLAILFKGKAIYQASIDSLSLTLPSNIIACIGIAIFGTYIILYKKKSDIKSIIIFILFMLPYITINIVLGQRGSLISYIIIIFLVVTYNQPVKKIRIKIIILFSIIYFIMCFLYANRAIASLLQKDIRAFFNIAFSKERIIKSINPATNEFGVGFANFNELYISNNYEFLYGRSYIEGLAITVPSFLYLGNKPKQITYVFRDNYFFSESKRSSIAGTGFSAILEAYWNFGFLGNIIIYILYGYILARLDCYYKKRNVFWMTIYFAISPFVISFHRSAFGDIISTVIIKTIIIYLIFILKTKIKGDKNEGKRNNCNINE